MIMSQNINWDEVIKKKSCGIDGCDLGKVLKVTNYAVVTEKGFDKKRSYLPKNLVEGFNGHTLQFRIMKAELKQYRVHRPEDS
jgi:hypothetical protein